MKNTKIPTKDYEEKIKKSIEVTHDIAWEKCEDCWIDTSVKLPDFNNPTETAFQQLANKGQTSAR